jgi:hypothetical protein
MRDVPVSTNGVLIHSESDWPCSWCRPEAWAGLGPNLLCLDCAVSITATLVSKLGSVARSDGRLEEGHENLRADAEAGGPGHPWDLFRPRYFKRW